MSRALRSSIRENRSEKVFIPEKQISPSSAETPGRRRVKEKQLNPTDFKKKLRSSGCESSSTKDQVGLLEKCNTSLDNHAEAICDPHITECEISTSADSNAFLFEELSSLIVGRKDEISRLTSLIRLYIDKRKSASIYVSGAPGTGKTAVILSVVQYFKKLGECDASVINCMQLSSYGDIYGRISIVLGAKKGKENNSLTDANSLEYFLNKYSQKRTIILVLDEVDQLSTRSQEMLYRIFEWPSKLACHIIVIGVANSLDLPERLLPRLKSKDYRPVHIVFPPYSQSELAEIVKVHLSKFSNSESCVEPLAIQLCSRKIAASTGDARTALDICRRAIDLAHQEARMKNMSDTFTPFNISIDSHITPSIQHISKALKESQVDSPLSIKSSNSVNTITTNNSDVPLHHKLLLASCILLKNQKSLRELPFSLLYDTYVLLCKKKQITGLSESELSAVCDLLDSRGFIQLTGPRYSVKATIGTPARLRRIRLRLDDCGVQQALMDDLLLSSVMDIKLEN
ncbi:Cell division control protein 6 like [Schistosoma japonicum]|nr:Cell division control protein 6 like [Schistosoma japonicum]